MTDKQALARYRLKRAEETLKDAEAMLQHNLSPASIINRAYYVMFYCAWALLLENHVPVKTSKHSGIISIFDKEFVLSGKIGRRFSQMLHETFEKRQEGDYWEMADLSPPEAGERVKLAAEFLAAAKTVITKEK